MTFWIIYILVQILFLGIALGRFNQIFFPIFRRQPTMMVDIFTQSLHHKKASYGPALYPILMSGAYGQERLNNATKR